MLTSYCHDGWALYVVDMKERQFLVMDPVETSEYPEEVMAKHEARAKKIVARLCKAIEECVPGWNVSKSGWNYEYN
jgi:hypothetical protein